MNESTRQWAAQHTVRTLISWGMIAHVHVHTLTSSVLGAHTDIHRDAGLKNTAARPTDTHRACLATIGSKIVAHETAGSIRVTDLCNLAYVMTYVDANAVESIVVTL
jgi:hypothetical protein